MPFPESDRVLYELNPLAEVICQLQFPPVLRIATEPPTDFQERMRDAYPVYRQEGGGLPGGFPVPPEMSQVLASLPIGLQGPPTHVFESEAGSRIVTLTRESIAITERNYTRWEELRGEISAACDALQAIYAPAFCTRIGLRYQDILDPQAIGLESVPWSELLHPAIAGALGAEDEIGAAVMGFGGAVEIRIEDVAQGAVRLQYGLVQTPPNHPARFALDADFYSNERTPIDRVPEILDRFNHIAGNLFRWAITERLSDALRPTPLAH